MVIDAYRKIVLIAYAFCVVMTCFLAVPVDYYTGADAKPRDSGYRPIWISKKEISYRTPNGYSGTIYTAEVNIAKVVTQFLGFTALAGVAFLLLDEQPKRDQPKRTPESGGPDDGPRQTDKQGE